MRRLLISGAVGLLTLTLAGVALAQFSQTSTITLSAHRAGQSSGITAAVHSSDPSAPGGRPKAATLLVVTLPTATRFNLGTSLVKPCKLTDAQLEVLGSTCPASSQIGSGSAVANAAPTLLIPIDASVKAYVRNSRTVILHVVTSIAPPIVIQATVSGPKLTIPIPTKSSGISLVLTSLRLKLPALGAGRNALITAGRCVAHRFTVTSHFVYADHSTLELTSWSSCS